jgi:hypothetical protein
MLMSLCQLTPDVALAPFGLGGSNMAELCAMTVSPVRRCAPLDSDETAEPVNDVPCGIQIGCGKAHRESSGFNQKIPLSSMVTPFFRTQGQAAREYSQTLCARRLSYTCNGM